MIGTLLWIFLPLALGFCIRLRPGRLLDATNTLLGRLVYLILLLMGLGMSSIGHLGKELGQMLFQAALLCGCILTCNIVVLALYDRFSPWAIHPTQPKRAPGQIGDVEANPNTGFDWRLLAGSSRQLACVALGVGIGKLIAAPPHAWIENGITLLLALLLFLIGIQLQSAGVRLRQMLLNRRAMMMGLGLTLSSWLGGLAAALMLGWYGTQALAFASGFGWYSLSGIVLGQAYGPVMGSVALFNDLGREIFALLFIPVLMQRFPSAAITVGGATSLDFTLPIIRQSGGIEVVPTTISFGFLANIIPPLAMSFFAHLAV